MAAESVIEVQRKLHEERERIEDAIAKEMLLRKSNVKEQINSEHRMSQLCERSLNAAQRLGDIYDDKDGLRSEELSVLGGPDEFTEFYRRLKGVRDYHHRNPQLVEEPMIMEFVKLEQQRQRPPEELQNLVDFTDEESYGKFLDLHELYDTYINIKGLDKTDYLSYLDTFDRLFEIPKEKKSNDYKKYITVLLDYLRGYLERIHPLTDQATLAEEVDREFEERWAAGNFPGWRRDIGGSAMAKHSGAHLDLSGFTSQEELRSLGLDRLKSALTALGLKCGGTLEERAKRLFSTKGKSPNEIDSSLFAKSKGPAQDERKQREVAHIEAHVYKLAELLGEQRAATRENVERRLARTAEELRDEESDESELSDIGEDEETVPYNPKNLPLGWDGKPIPYWLYKLHGLNLSYTCEICGNAVYKGPKNFQRHFSEWRHAHGMRCLGIPNTAHFANVTAIADALALWEKLKETKARERWEAEQGEEFEDTWGNVVTKKTYEDLRRQGLL